MTRPKRHQSSADVEAEIRRLEAERQRLLDAEDQRRGALVREYLSAPNGDALREALAPFVGRRDVAIFGLDTRRESARAGERDGARDRARPAARTEPSPAAPANA